MDTNEEYAGLNILMVAPFPPPHTGNSLPALVIHNALVRGNRVVVINLNKPDHRSGVFSVGRFLDILAALYRVWRLQSKNEVVYLAIAESGIGNLRDILIYAICSARLERMLIHLLGGENIRRFLREGAGWRFRINRRYLSRIGAIIVEGDTQKRNFLSVADASKIHVVPNFAQELLFVQPEDIKRKFEGLKQIRVLFLSNLLPGKGHWELLKAVEKLPRDLRVRFRLDIAGKAISPYEEDELNAWTSRLPSAQYHGSVQGEVRRSLFAAAHVFCLPTYYPYEGQPLSILEAYASGCVVVTTNHSGIRDVFKPEENGYEVEKKSAESIAQVLTKIAAAPAMLMMCGIAEHNNSIARADYSQGRFESRMQAVIRTLAGGAN